MGSAAMDKFGNLVIGFSASSPAIHPQIRYAGRLATDPLNTLAQGEAHLFNGAGSQLGTGNRWGDYSSMAIDPVDDRTFWYTTEYYIKTAVSTGARGSAIFTSNNSPEHRHFGVVRPDFLVTPPNGH